MLNKKFKSLSKVFKKDLDLIWEARDVNNDGLLQRDECKLFLSQVQKTVKDSNVKKRYRTYEFDALFDQFDEDGNGYIEKREMVQFLQFIFLDSDQNTKAENLRSNLKTSNYK